jgi:glutathione-regulated potassium-efflux system ancillary protein KefG
MTTSTLVLVAHPDLAHSRVNAAMAAAARAVPHVEVLDLYSLYPHFLINVEAEHTRLAAHKRWVLQFPMYWYGAPAMVAQWCEEVLVRGFAYGTGAVTHQHDLQLAVSTGRTRQDGASPGAIEAEVIDLLKPFEHTARYCGMRYQKPLIHLAHEHDDPEHLAAHVAEYAHLLKDSRRG